MSRDGLPRDSRLLPERTSEKPRRQARLSFCVPIIELFSKLTGCRARRVIVNFNASMQRLQSGDYGTTGRSVMINVTSL